MATITQAKRMSLHYFNEYQPVFWWGAPGIGKSEGIQQLADEHFDGNLIDFRATLRDPVDLRGLPKLDEKAGVVKWLPPEELPNEKRHGKRGILFLDELNAANPQVQVACYSLVLDRRLANYELPEGWIIAAAGNRAKDRAAAQRMSRALSNRFAHIDVEADASSWLESYAVHHCDPMLVGFIRFRPDLLIDEDPGKGGTDDRAYRTPRSWTRAGKHCNAPDDIRMGLIKGQVGEEGAVEFEAFIRTYQNLPDLDDIFDDPKGTPLPKEPSAIYAVTAALGRHSTRQNFEAALTYAARLGPDYEIVTCMDATNRDESLTKSKAYISFVKRHPDVQIGRLAA